MANGNMGKKVSEATRLRALELLAKGSSYNQVAQRLGISNAFVRNAWRDEQERLAINQEIPDDALLLGARPLRLLARGIPPPLPLKRCTEISPGALATGMSEAAGGPKA